MVNRMVFKTLTFFLMITASMHLAAEGSTAKQDKAFAQSLTDSQDYRVWLNVKDADKPPIGDYHQWVIGVADLKGNGIDSVKFSLNGGMPSHGHGLPSSPQVTQYLGDGSYLIEGMLFGMSGEWQLNFVMLINGKQEKVQFNFLVEH